MDGSGSLQLQQLAVVHINAAHGCCVKQQMYCLINGTYLESNGRNCCQLLEPLDKLTTLKMQERKYHSQSHVIGREQNVFGQMNKEVPLMAERV